MTELTNVYDKYIKLLEDEIKGVAGIAYVHGWRSSRYKEGKKLREKIAKLKEIHEN